MAPHHPLLFAFALASASAVGCLPTDDLDSYSRSAQAGTAGSSGAAGTSGGTGGSAAGAGGVSGTGGASAGQGGSADSGVAGAGLDAGDPLDGGVDAGAPDAS